MQSKAIYGWVTRDHYRSQKQLAHLNARDAEVGDLGAPARVQQDVLRLEVAVHHAGVQVRQALRHIVRQLYKNSTSAATLLSKFSAVKARMSYDPSWS
jgi:hypothetical protein